jgi:hypothetical protein
VSYRATTWRGDRDFSLETAKGQIAGHTSFHKWGGNPDVGTGAYEALWSGGGSYTGFLTAADTVRVKAGGNAADTAAGAGARTVKIYGLDENWALANETVTTAGASASSSTTTTFIRVFRVLVVNVGSYGASNVGAITIETTGGTVVAHIPAGDAITQQCIYTVPANHVLMIDAFRFDVFANKTAKIRFRERHNANDTATPTSFHTVSTWEGATGIAQLAASPPYAFNEYTDVLVEAIADGGAATSCYAEMDGILISLDGSPVSPPFQ